MFEGDLESGELEIGQISSIVKEVKPAKVIVEEIMSGYNEARSRDRTRNRITDMLGIRYPIIQAGMVWASGWKLASAVTNAGGLGIIGSASMKADLLEEHILKCQKAIPKNAPYGVNIAIMFSKYAKP